MGISKGCLEIPDIMDSVCRLSADQITAAIVNNEYFRGALY